MGGRAGPASPRGASSRERASAPRPERNPAAGQPERGPRALTRRSACATPSPRRYPRTCSSAPLDARSSTNMYREPASGSAPATVGQPIIRVVGRGRRRRQRGQPDGRGRGRGHRVPGRQHRPAVAAAVDGRPHAPHRGRAHARPGLGLGRQRRPPGGDGGLRPDEGPAQGLGHDLHRRRRRRRDGHRRSADRGADRQGSRCAHRRHRDQAIRIRGHTQTRAGRPGRGCLGARRWTR